MLVLRPLLLRFRVKCLIINICDGVAAQNPNSAPAVAGLAIYICGWKADSHQNWFLSTLARAVSQSMWMRLGLLKALLGGVSTKLAGAN